MGRGNSPIDGSALQAIAVTAARWASSEAALWCFQRKDGLSPWIVAGEKIPAVVGRNGLGWGRGIHPDEVRKGPEKREGDGRAPAGIFRLPSAFGYASPGEVSWIRLPYRQITPTLQCVDDARSVHYNRIMDTAEVHSDWSGGEDMLRQDDGYRLGIVIGHNMEPTVPHCGSCIFLHIWEGPFSATAGCTAIGAGDLERILRWLDSAAMPVLIQLPQAEYESRRTPWHLP